MQKVKPQTISIVLTIAKNIEDKEDEKLGIKCWYLYRFTYRYENI